MKEAKCYDLDDFRDLLMRVHGNKRPSDVNNLSEVFALQDERKEILDSVERKWEEITNENWRIYRRLGYLELIVYPDYRVERKKLKRGRPKEEKSKGHMLNVRIDDKLKEILDKYCNTKNKSESQVIRELIQRLEYKI